MCERYLLPACVVLCALCVALIASCGMEPEPTPMPATATMVVAETSGDFIEPTLTVAEAWACLNTVTCGTPYPTSAPVSTRVPTQTPIPDDRYGEGIYEHYWTSKEGRRAICYGQLMASSPPEEEPYRSAYYMGVEHRKKYGVHVMEVFPDACESYLTEWYLQSDLRKSRQIR